MKRLLFPVPTTIVVAAVFAGVAWGMWFTVSMLDWQPPDWNRAQVLLRERSIYLGLPSALISAWCARGIRSGSVVFPLNAPRGRMQILLRMQGIIFLGATFGAIVALFPGAVHASAGLNATPVFALVSIWMTLGCSIALGFFFGTLLPDRFWVLGVPLAVGLVLLLPLLANNYLLVNSGLSATLLSPIWMASVPFAGQYAPAYTAVVSLCWFLLLSTMTLLLTAGVPQLAPAVAGSCATRTSSASRFF